MKTVSVDITDRSYEIRIDSQLQLGEAVVGLKGCAGLIVSDTNVDPIYGDDLQKVLGDAGIACKRLVLDAGEASKSFASMERIYDAALEAGMDRKGVIFALGGGMVGDVAGFAAATYMRGVSFVQIPTSLLAMVDSSVGGKTAVNLKQGKNLVGSFYQPVEVGVSLDSLKTLPDREFSAGLAETIKYGIIWDAEFFRMLEDNIDAIMSRDESILSAIVARCCEIKGEVVAVDEREAGVRGILNFGHTLAHSLENLCGYGECLHGEAVAVGMVYAMRLSVLTKDLDPADEARVRALLANAGLPVTVKDLKKEISWDDARRVMVADKKTVAGVPRFVVAEGLGSVVFGCEIEESVLAGAYSALCSEED